MSNTVEIKVPEYREVIRERAREALKRLLGVDEAWMAEIDRYIAACNTTNESK